MAEWRFLLFTIIVTVKSPIWNVIRIVSPPFGDVTNRLPFVQRPVFTVLQFSTSCNICFIWPRRAQQCRVRTQSAAVLSSLAPHDSKARLRAVTSSRDSWRSHVHRAHTAQRVQLFKHQTGNVGGRGGRPSSFSGGFKGGILFGKRMPPLVSRRARRSPSRAYAGKGAALSGYPSLRAARGKHLRPCGRKKRAPLRVLFFKSLRISRTGTSGRLRR